MRHTATLSLIFPLLLTACQQQPHAPQTPPDAQRQQIASLIAGTRYLKYQCAQTALPSDGKIEQAAYRVAQERGWAPSSDVAAYSETLYQGLLHDVTSPAEQCAEFNQLLQPFIISLSTQ